MLNVGEEGVRQRGEVIGKTGESLLKVFLGLGTVSYFVRNRVLVRRIFMFQTPRKPPRDLLGFVTWFSGRF